jgi:hypothetical protein
MNWSDFMGADPSKGDTTLPEVVVRAKRIENNAPIKNLQIDGDFVYFQQGKSWYMTTSAPLEEGGARTYGYDARAGWVFVRSDYESYKARLSAAMALADMMSATMATAVSLFMGGGIGATLPARAGLRTVPIAGRFAAQGARMGRGVKSGGDFAFGLGDDLFKFAGQKGFKTYRDFSQGLQLDKIASVIENGSNRLHFNLTGFSKIRYKMFDPKGFIGRNNVTNWELHKIYNTPGALQRTTFYKFENGVYKVVSKPF